MTETTYPQNSINRERSPMLPASSLLATQMHKIVHRLVESGAKFFDSPSVQDREKRCPVGAQLGAFEGRREHLGKMVLRMVNPISSITDSLCKYLADRDWIAGFERPTGPRSRSTGQNWRGMQSFLSSTSLSFREKSISEIAAFSSARW